MRTINTRLLFAAIWMTSMVFRAGAQTLPDALNDAYGRLKTATELPALMDATNRFTLIASKWDHEWAANYYSAYARTLASFKETDTKRRDQLLDAADDYTGKAIALRPSDAETMVLAAYVAFARFSVDPANRWKKYLGIFNEELEKAKKIDPDNPRIYYLEGIPVFNKPVLYGGGKKKARPYFEKAAGLFAKQDTTSILKPFWGETPNNEYLKQSQ